MQQKLTYPANKIHTTTIQTKRLSCNDRRAWFSQTSKHLPLNLPTKYAPLSASFSGQKIYIEIMHDNQEAADPSYH